ncbi:SDR family oxidoreductase [Mesorhizobium sp. M7A.F.Ca.CA.001.07.2.1]|uniref:SDR family NAD(P)-dependent oxidoreductase n=2 Tax=Phyllobacteriaceae TaxID=69277 RepID=UPI000FCAF4D6|nr:MULTISPECIES: SDR family oxidoreductase [Mesorhizobium]RVB38306.1 SDR family oxidoreductase [Mesorhizobium sp. M7A.F.Ca.CA.004.05.1.1]MCF6121715.1 SDR family oxidoreductase [Mesorhizobium ciceri]MCQ8812294.1 SDR family oxidoreductase [Mesorhizobium sp. SEMIA396]RUX80492.1 SDR family oxidoreductase [Mesorhizobium sp. M7A.F.Ca.CA.004.08.2.1]RUX89898.1 SDR family oxidoreductase [Mesorhizobium sp. M7A.F.Ca.CA.004.08.1.1]
MPYSDFKGKVAIITGAGAGIGLAIAEALVKEGVRVAGMDINLDGVSRVEQRVGKDKFLALQVDITDPANCKRGVDAAAEHFGGLHVLINNAALGMNAVHPRYETLPLQIEDVSEELWKKFMLTNVCGTFNMSRQVVPRLRPQKWGRIINVSTSYLTMMRPGFSPYGPSKAALEAWSMMLSRELDESGITVNVVLPGGPVDTAMVPDRDGLDRETLIRPEMMAPMILALLTSEGDKITGKRFLAVDWDNTTSDPQLQTHRTAAWPELATPLAALAPKKG